MEGTDAEFSVEKSVLGRWPAIFFEKNFLGQLADSIHSRRSSRPDNMAQTSGSSSDRWPKDVGILAMEIYIPRTAVSQTALGTSGLKHSN